MMTEQQTDRLINALEKLTYGTATAPTGFEALSIAIAGNNLNKPLSEAVGDVADSLQSIADNIDRLIDEVKNLKYGI